MLACYYTRLGAHKSSDALGTIPVPDLLSIRHKLRFYPERLLLIHVHAAALNPIDLIQRNRRSRLEQIIFPQTFLVVHGFDFLAIVVEISDGQVDKDNEFKLGDVVFGFCKAVNKGSLAEYMVVSESICVAAPDEAFIPYYKAASIPVAGTSAIEGLRKCGLDELQTSKNASKRLLILGGSGGIGTLAIQLAKNLFKVGFVATTASPGEKTELCKELGGNLVVDYRSDPKLLSLKDHLKFDAVLDCIGTATVAFPYLKKNGFFCSLSGGATAKARAKWLKESDVKVPAIFGMFFTTAVGQSMFNVISGAAFMRCYLRVSVGRQAKYEYAAAYSNKQIMQLLKNELEAGRLKPVVFDENVFKLEDALLAIEKLENTSVPGKVVITMKQ